MTTRPTILCRWLAASALLLATSAMAQPWPDKQTKFVVPFPAGGVLDVLTRTVAEPLQTASGKTIVVENLPGAAGNIGIQQVARAQPDGATVLFVPQGNITINATLLPNMPFKWDKDFTPVTLLAYAHNVLVVHPSVPANNLKELVALSKTTKLNFAVTAMGSAPHMAGVAVERASGAKWEYIPYKGGSQAIQDTIGGQTQVLMNGMLATLPFVQSGKLKVLGVSRATRVPLLADVPTIAEQGVKGFESGTWQGVLAPAGTPPAVMAKLAAELTRIIRSPEIRSRLTAQGAEVYTMSPTEFTQFFEKERVKWATVVTQSGVKLD